MLRTTRTQHTGMTRAIALLIVAAAIMAMAVAGTAWAQPAPATVPAAPGNPEASLVIPETGTYQVRIAWDDPDDQSITVYTITRSDGQTFTSSRYATTYTDHSTQHGASYTYTVKAANSDGEGPASAQAQVTIPDAPAAVTGLTATTRPVQSTHDNVHITLTWSAGAEPQAQAQACQDSYPVTGYQVSRSIGTGPTQELVVAPAGTDISHADETAAFNTSYTYHVTPVSRIGNGETSSTTVSTPRRSLPISAPTGLDVDQASTPDPFNGTIVLEWTTPLEGPTITGYRVRRQDPGATQAFQQRSAGNSPEQGDAPAFNRL